MALRGSKRSQFTGRRQRRQGRRRRGGYKKRKPTTHNLIRFSRKRQYPAPIGIGY